MASVSGSKLAFVSPNDQPVNLILTNGNTVSGITVRGALNIEIFTGGSGPPLPGVDATATIGGAVKISSDEVQAGTKASVETLGTGNFEVIDETGSETITLGTGAQTVVGSTGDTIFGGNGGRDPQVIDLTGTAGKSVAGPMTVVGGAGPLFVEARNSDSITGGSGPLTVFGGTSDTITGGPGPLTVLGDMSDTITGGSGPLTVLGDMSDKITGGSGALTVLGGTSDTITGGTGGLFIDAVTKSAISAGTGGTTVLGGDNDVVHDSGSGPLSVDIMSRSGIFPLTAGSGAETVDLGAGHGPTTLRDTSVWGGSGPLATTTVTGFSTTHDIIASDTSVTSNGHFEGTSTVSGGNSILTFVDGSKMTLVGITDITKVTFTR